MINFFNKNILYFTTWAESFGDGINNLKHMYCFLHENDYRSRLHVVISSLTNRCINWMISKDNLVDRVYIQPEYDNKASYLSLLSDPYDEVYFRNVYVNNEQEVFDYFSKKQCKCYAFTDIVGKNTRFENAMVGRETYKFFKKSFKDQREKILSLASTSKKAILMPFSTRRYATFTKETILKMCDILIKQDYTIFLCGEITSPYSPHETFYTSYVRETIEFLNKHAPDKVINLTGMCASKVAELASDCDVILHSSTGAIQISYYDYAKCPWIILENGRECMMNGLSNIFSSTPVKIVPTLCEHKYCQHELENNPSCAEKIKECNVGHPLCVGDEFNFGELEEMIRELR